MFKNLFFGIFLFSLSCQNLQGQEKNIGNDSVKVYKKIENFSNKNKFNQFIYKLLFKSNRKVKPTSNLNRNKYFIEKSFERSEGKIIRNIYIKTLDPFGYTVENQKDVPEKGFEKTGNRLHLKTKNWTIRNLLLFKKNELLDSLKTKESERLIRRQRYVRSVIIKPIEIPNNKDSVDVSIRVLDSWSLIPNGSLSNTQANFEITERNFLGLGHEFENDFTKRFTTDQNAYLGRYAISNIKNTFINSTISYENSLNNYTTKSIKIERPFYSPLTRLAGGMYFENKFYIDSLPDNNTLFAKQTFKLETQDYWLGHSFKIFKGKNFDFRSTNLVTSIGYKNSSYLITPSLAYDSSRFFASEKLYLATIGLNIRKFYEDKYLFNFGIIEDVPYGQVYALTGGFQDKNYKKRSYFGGRFSYGDYFSFGYLGTNIEWGSFFTNGITEEMTFKIEINYFTNLLYLGDWKIRQFIKPILTIGNNRAPIIKDRVIISDENGIVGFNNPLINGTKKLTLALQTQTYAPGNWHGFHFSPYLNATFGLLGDKSNQVFDHKLYSKFSLGVLINNDYLVFNSFQISFSYYPSIPYEGSNILKTNSFKNNDLALPDFQIGQPIIVPYR